MDEIWKDIEGYEDIYQVSNLGRIISLKRHVDCTKSKKGYRVIGGYFLKQSDDKDGYKAVGLSKHGKCTKRLVHRLVADAFLDNPSNLPQINHKDGVKKNNIITNLEWSSASDNIQHAHNNGLMKVKRGSANTNSKLSEEDVYHIKKLIRLEKMTTRSIANLYNVSFYTIRSIRSGENWKHIPWPNED